MEVRLENKVLNMRESTWQLVCLQVRVKIPKELFKTCLSCALRSSRVTRLSHTPTPSVIPTGCIKNLQI